jgi:hypothetical protein
VVDARKLRLRIQDAAPRFFYSSTNRATLGWMPGVNGAQEKLADAGSTEVGSCDESPLQRLLLLEETELPKYNHNSQFSPLAEALEARPMTASEIDLFRQRMHSFRSPKITQLVSKRLLAANAKKYMEANNMPLFPVPLTFVLPDENFEALSIPPDGLWIAKPHGLCQGKGIRVFNGLDAAVKQNRRNRVVQRYLEPLLLDRYKFDFRLYVFITSICPLEAHLHELGYGRFCVHEYNTATLDDRRAHLSNLAVNMPGCNDRSNQSHVRVETLWQELAKKGVDVPLAKENIKDALRKVLLCTAAAVNQKKSQRSESAESAAGDGERKHFQIVGFDVLLTKEHTPMVLEANITPAVFDIGVQRQLIFDVLTMVFDPSPVAGLSACRDTDSATAGTAQEGGAVHENGDGEADAKRGGGAGGGLAVMAALAKDWASGGDQLLHADEWCVEHWTWRRAPSSPADQSTPQEAFHFMEAEEAMVMPVASPPVPPEGRAHGFVNGFTPLF